MIQYKYGFYLLTCVCGLIDITCFMGLNGVFAEMMTGNLMMIAISLGTGHPIDASGKYFHAIAAFVVGLFMGSFILKHTAARRQTLVAYSAVWILVALAAAGSYAMLPDQTNNHGLLLVGVLSTAMGIHCATVRAHGISDLATNLMTMTMTALVTDAVVLGRAHERWRRRLLSIILFVVSGAIGAYLVKYVDMHWGLVLALLLLTLAIPCLAQGRPNTDA